jgi:pyruvate/2-oxoglutarate dehydrogenase complex dihydrolipoamide dehydrogenase (E3) component
MNWMKAQRAATSRLAEELRNGLQTVNVRIANGAGSLLSEHQVRITDSFGKCEEVEAEHVILATGSRPDFPSSFNSRFFNSDDLIARVYPQLACLLLVAAMSGANLHRSIGPSDVE